MNAQRALRFAFGAIIALCASVGCSFAVPPRGTTSREVDTPCYRHFEGTVTETGAYGGRVLVSKTKVPDDPRCPNMSYGLSPYFESTEPPDQYGGRTIGYGWYDTDRYLARPPPPPPMPREPPGLSPLGRSLEKEIRRRADPPPSHNDD